MSDIQRLHDRIDALEVQQDRRHEEITERLHGIELAIERRLTLLEAVGEIGGRGFWLVAAAVASLLTGVVAAAVTAAMRRQ